MRVGIEIGGTFTDLVCADGSNVFVLKVPSVPRCPEEGVFAALEAANIDLSKVTELVHGSTVATNAVLERKGARCGLLVSEGFRDVLLLRRGERAHLFDPFYQHSPALIARRDTLEVPERVLANGSVETALEMAKFEDALSSFLKSGDYAAVAICLLNSFAFPDHEHTLAEWIRERFPDLSVTCSVDVTREFREYERASTTALSAYVQPVIDAYLGRVATKLDQDGFCGRLSVMQSNGGRIPAAAMRKNAVTALLSGPAAGVAGAIHQAGRSDLANLITLDIGGTSADVCVIENGKAALTRSMAVDGHPVLLPMVDIGTVGAGGGSLIWVDDGGMLRVGPRSAGADPGPACYGRGGTQPALTDAQLLSGRMRPDARLGASTQLDLTAAEVAFAPLAETLGMSIHEVAGSAIRIFITNVVAAIRLISTRRGHDPRDYALVAYGGAGPLHAAEVAAELGVRTVVVPPNPGVMSAYGLLASDYCLHASETHRTPVADDSMATMRQVVARLADYLRAEFQAMGQSGDLQIDTVLDMRLTGQAFEIPVEIDTATINDLDAPGLRDLFMAEYKKVYHHDGGISHRPIEIVTYRVGLRVPQLDAPEFAARNASNTVSAAQTRNLIEAGKTVSAAWIARSALDDGTPIHGPAIVEDQTATIFLPTGWMGAVDVAGNLIMRTVQ